MYIDTHTHIYTWGEEKEQIMRIMRMQGIIFQSPELTLSFFSKLTTLFILNFALLPTNMELGVWRRALIHSYTQLEHLLRHLFVSITDQPNFLS